MQAKQMATLKSVTECKYDLFYLTPTKSSDNVKVESPLNVQHGSKETGTRSVKITKSNVMN